MIFHGITIDPIVIRTFCQKHHIQRLSLFGSVLRDDFDDESDIDLLVEFDPAYKVGFIRLAAMELELGVILQRKVDIRTLAEIHNAFRHDVIQSARVQYVCG